MFEKYINILDYAISSLWRRKFKNLSVIIVFSAVIFLIASFQLTTNSLTRLAEKHLANAPEITVQKMVAGRQEGIAVKYRNRLDKIFGIRRIVPRVWGYYFDEASGANYTVIGLDWDQMPKNAQLDQIISNGRFPRNPGEVALGSGVVNSMQLGGRQNISFFRPDLSLKAVRITGFFDVSSDLLTADTIVMGIEDARDLFGIDETQATDLLVYVANPGEIETIAKKIATVLSDTRVVTRLQIGKTYQVIFGWRSGFASICLITALAAFIIFAWDKASGLSPEEKREIGILKVLGWQTADIIALRFWEGFILALSAFLIGFLLAYAHVGWFSAGLFAPVIAGWSVLTPHLQLVPRIELGDLLIMFSLTVLPYMAATVIPSWRAAIIPPDSVIM